VAWTTWITLMGSVGITVLALAVAGPVARRTSPAAFGRLTARLALAAAVLSALAVPAVLTEIAQQASPSGGYDYAAAWHSLFADVVGVLSGLEITGTVVAAVLLAPLAVPRVTAGRARAWLLGGGLAAGAAALAVAKFPADASDGWGSTVFSTAVWMLHLFGGAIWIGGLAGLLLLAWPGGVTAARRGAFWSAMIRRYSAVAMGSVAAIVLSGLFLYWEHVDGPEQLFTTMYGRVLGVKILIFGTLLLLGMANQFWLHPRIEALRAAGDDRPLHAVLGRRFPALIGAELLLGLTVLFVAPFLHGSARNEAFQASAARHAASASAPLPKIPAKQASASTWVLGTAETLVVVAVMIGGYRVSGRVARNRAGSAAARRAATEAADPLRQ
jgi:putative copper export protein